MSLAERARLWRAQRRRAILLEASAVAAAGSAAALGAAALLDRWAVLPRGARLAALASWGAWLAWTLRSRLWTPWRALDRDEVFAAAALAWPRTRTMFASAWALRDGPAPPGTSEELRAEHVARADRLAAELPSEPLFAWTPSPAARRLAAAAAASLALNAAWGDRASWRRAAAPWLDEALERWVEVSPGDARLDWGAAAIVRARPRPEAAARGVRAAGLVLETRGSDGGWRALPWTRIDSGGAERSVGALTVPLDYRVRWRDLAGSAYRLEPAAPPRWSRAAAIVSGSRGERRFVLGEDSAVRARRGDWISIEAEPEAPLSSAAMRLSGRPAAIAMRSSGRSWRGGFAAVADAALSFELASADGRRDPSPPAYAVTVAADAPPAVELLSPQVPLIASPDDEIVVAYSARDDGAVTRASLKIHVAGRPDREIALPIPAPPRAEVLGDASWPLSGLPAGARAEFWIEAFDDAALPQRGRSESGSVEIVDARAIHAAALEARGAADAAVESAAARAEAARDAARRGDLAASAELTRELRREWTAARRSLGDWARASAADPRGDPGLAEEAARAASEFARAGEDGLPAAEESLARGDAGRAALEQEVLADQARGVQRALREGARAQSAQDYADRMARAGRSGEEIATAAERLAARGSQGTVSAAELEALEDTLDDIERAFGELRKALKALPEIPSELADGRARELPLDAASAAAGELRRALRSGDVAAAAKAARSLAESLRTLAKTLDEAGRRSAEVRGRRGEEAAGRVRRAWEDAVDAQTKAVEDARALDADRLARLVEAQKTMLRGLPGRFEAAASSSAAPGPSLPPADPARAQAAAASQSRAVESARRLRGEIRDAARGLGYLSGRTARRVEDAIAEENAGEEALRRGDSGEGLRHGESALRLLQEGGRDAESAASSAGSAMGGAGSSLGAMRAAPRGAAGAAMGRVRLPSADEYRPPRALREELERSLSEPRPAARDAEIKEYFKRLAR